MPYVLVQKEGGFRPLMEWVVTDSAQSEWDRVCGTLVTDALRETRRPSFNVFLVFEQEELASRDREALTSLITSARCRTWGATLLLVLAGPPSFKAFERSARVDLELWLRALLSGRVSDLLEISEPVNRRAPDRFLEALRDRASGTDSRREMVNAIASHRAWRCVLPRERLYLADFLGPNLLLNLDTPQPFADTLIVLAAADPETQIAIVERHLKQGDGASQCSVVTYVHEPAFELRQFCVLSGLREPFPVRGEFELWYLLLRLNEHAREHRAEDSYAVHPVALAGSPMLKVTELEDAPSLLITSVFDYADTGQWLLAANEVGEILQRLPFGIERRVEMGVTPDRLSVILEKMPAVSVWIHIGHGNGRSGLQVPDDGSVDVDKWLKSFNKRHLRLALFLTCDSDVVAKRFAEEGASVAIGFVGEVESDKTWHLAVEVVKAIVAEGTRGGAILAGFGAGLPRFEAVQKLDARARAYYPRRG
jgi:hypothetical protein